MMSMMIVVAVEEHFHQPVEHKKEAGVYPRANKSSLTIFFLFYLLVISDDDYRTKVYPILESVMVLMTFCSILVSYSTSGLPSQRVCRCLSFS